MTDRSQIDRILSTFKEINTIPRCSKQEEKLGAYLRQRAEANISGTGSTPMTRRK